MHFCEGKAELFPLEELLTALFSMPSLSYQKVGDELFIELIAF
jgi:hypothetical protein